jgi:hypothetical protein
MYELVLVMMILVVSSLTSPLDRLLLLMLMLKAVFLLSLKLKIVLEQNFVVIQAQLLTM